MGVGVGMGVDMSVGGGEGKGEGKGEGEGGHGQGQGQPVVVKGGQGRIEGRGEEEVAGLTQNELTSGSGTGASTGTGPSPFVHALLWWSPRVCSGLFLVLMLIWLCGTKTTPGEGGFNNNATIATTRKMTVFAWHALFMTLFAVVFTNEAVLSFVAPWSEYFPRVGGSGVGGMAARIMHVICHVLGIKTNLSSLFLSFPLLPPLLPPLPSYNDPF